MVEHIETVVIGGGQAGLSTGYYLKEQGRPFVILEANPRIGEQWRKHYDSLVLFTARKYDSLPGLAFPGDPHGFPGRDEVAAYLERYATHHELPVRTSVRVERVARQGDGTFLVTLDGGEMSCDNVVVAVGKAGQPKAPGFADQLDPGVTQLHSAAYKWPGQIPPGPVLIVGASHSGADIALELAGTHAVTLVGRDTGQIPVRPDDRRARFLFPLFLFLWRHAMTRRTPLGRKMMPLLRSHGAPLLRVRTEDLLAAGVERRTGRVGRVQDGKAVLTDGTAVEARTVIWATGFGHRFDFIEGLPLTDEGWPDEYRGVVHGMPGLFFCGLIFQYSFASMVFPGIGRDAAYVARQVAARAGAAKQAVAV